MLTSPYATGEPSLPAGHRGPRGLSTAGSELCPRVVNRPRGELGSLLGRRLFLEHLSFDGRAGGQQQEALDAVYHLERELGGHGPRNCGAGDRPRATRGGQRCCHPSFAAHLASWRSSREAGDRRAQRKRSRAARAPSVQVPRAQRGTVLGRPGRSAMLWTSCVRRSRRAVDRVLKLGDQIRSPHGLDQHHVGTCANRQPKGGSHGH
jgi:hypothetical protein